MVAIAKFVVSSVLLIACFAILVEAQLPQCQTSKVHQKTKLPLPLDPQSMKMNKDKQGNFILELPKKKFKARLEKQNDCVKYTFQVFDDNWMPLSGNYAFTATGGEKQETFEIIRGDLCVQKIGQTDLIDEMYVTSIQVTDAESGF